jgi:hypothetical protein
MPCNLKRTEGQHLKVRKQDLLIIYVISVSYMEEEIIIIIIIIIWFDQLIQFNIRLIQMTGPVAQSV